LKGEPGLDESAMLERIGTVEAVLGSLRQAEILSEKHWTLVYLLQNPGWRGEGILVEKRGSLGTIIIPSLALEIRMHLKRDLPLDQLVPLKLNQVDLPRLDVNMRVEVG
jgi:exoribonuclease II